MQKIKALLIDDEEYARQYLRAMLSVHPDVEIVGEASALQPARRLIHQGGYDFMFLDIKLGPDTGFDLVPDVPADKPIIFVTGYEHHAQKAFEVNAVDYLLKPVRAGRLTESLDRLRERRRSGPPRPVPVPPPSPVLGLKATDTVVLEVNQRARLVRVEEISLLVAQENYTSVHLVDGTATLVRRSLKSWTQSLPKEDFVRSHRNSLVNLNHITSYHHAFPRRITLRVVGVALAVVVSRFASGSLKARLRARFPAR